MVEVSCLCSASASIRPVDRMVTPQQHAFNFILDLEYICLDADTYVTYILRKNIYYNSEHVSENFQCH